MAFHLSTKESLLFVIDDIEIIAKELVEQAVLPKHQKMSPAEHALLVDLLVSKDEEFRRLIELASEQANVECAMDDLRVKVNVHDRDIYKLQKSLKDAELIMATAIFQAHQKLESIKQANKRPVNSEELIKYAHRISSANAVSAPLSWCIGDLRRPYPTDVEMRNGFLGKSDLSSSSGVPQPSGSNVPVDTQRNLGDVPSAYQSQFNWSNLGDLNMAMGPSTSSHAEEQRRMGYIGKSKMSTSLLDVANEARAHQEAAAQDDVEVMSTDSSSSSSSDSQ